MIRAIRTSALLLPVVAAVGCVGPVEELFAPDFALEAPEQVDLGWIARGDVAEGRFPITNVGASAVGLDGARVLAAVSPGNLSVEVELGPAVLQPGESADAVVRLIASLAAEGEVTVPIRVLSPALPEDDPRLPVVELLARISPSGLVAEPNPLTIGPVLYLETATATVAIRNLRSRPVEVFALRHSDGRAQYDEAVTRGAFGPLPRVDGTGRLTTLGPQESTVVTIAYTAPEGPGEAKEQAVWRIGSCPDSEACALTLIVQGLPDHEAPIVSVSPSGAHFGPTPIGAEVERDIRISNIGHRALAISDFVFEDTPEHSATLPANMMLDRNQTAVVQVRYHPNDVGSDNTELRFRTNDPMQRTVRVRVTGSGVELPPCSIGVTPPALDFGVVPVFESRTLVATVRGIGGRCIVFDPQIVLDPGVADRTFVLDENAPQSVVLQRGWEAIYPVTFAPALPGRSTGRLILRTNSDEQTEIPLRGSTPAGIALSCTPERSIEVGAPARLIAALSQDSVAATYRWQLLSGPMRDGQIAAVFQPNANSGPDVELVPDELGRYEIEAEVITTDGDRHVCRTAVTAQSTGLKARLTWDGAGDLDLHLHRRRVAPWFGPEDCHFENMNPIWASGVPAGAGANPTLDGDDTSGDGPENIHIDRPEIGVHYALAVGHFERARGRRARVELFCGRATRSLDVTSRPFGGTETGACTGNDFWTIATLVFTAPDHCEVEMIDTYRQTREACAAF